MIIAIIVILIIAFIYIYKPEILDISKKYIECRFLKLERLSSRTKNIAINYANFIILDDKGIAIPPLTITVYPSIIFGDGITEQSKSATSDIVMLETADTDTPVIEFDLGATRNVSQVIIINRRSSDNIVNKLVNERLKDTKLSFLSDKRIIMFEFLISDIRHIYSINV
jgi:hypothetical protein